MLSIALILSTLDFKCKRCFATKWFDLPILGTALEQVTKIYHHAFIEENFHLQAHLSFSSLNLIQNICEVFTRHTSVNTVKVTLDCIGATQNVPSLREL